MAAIFAEGDDAKKVAARIRRMEKLMSRISKKQQQLNKYQEPDYFLLHKKNNMDSLY